MKKNNIKITEYKNILKQIVHFNCVLETLNHCVYRNFQNCTCSLNTDIRNQKEMSMVHNNNIQNILNTIKNLKKLFSENAIAYLRQKTIRNQRTREQRKKKKIMELENKQNKSYDLKRKIDNWLKRIAQKEVVMKKENEIKYLADSTLSQVKKKIVDIKKCIKLLKLLGTLKNIRMSKLKGLFMLETSDKFYQRVEALNTFLNKQLKTYEYEQKTLQVMLETEQALDSKRDLKLLNISVKNETAVYRSNIEKYLFGNIPVDTNLFLDYYDLPSRDIHAFLHVRHQWGQYLSTHHTADHIPHLWVTPCNPSTDLWNNLLEK